MTTVYSRHSSPLGELLLVGEREHAGAVRLTGLYLAGQRHGPAVDPAWAEDRDAFGSIAAQLDGYLAGERTAFDVPLELHGTPFQRRAWAELERIRYGETVTYAEIARRIGRPGAARAVGSAVARNPVAIVVPCHRVVGSGGSLTGYAGGLDRKRRLLDLERRVAGGVRSEAGSADGREAARRPMPACVDRGATGTARAVRSTLAWAPGGAPRHGTGRRPTR